jgi:hypothetical protein
METFFKKETSCKEKGEDKQKITMSGAYEGSQLTYSSALNLVSIPPTEFGFTSSEWYSFHPETSVKDQNADIIFNYNASNQHYTQLDSAYLYIKAKVVKQNVEKLKITSDQVTVVKNVGAALFNCCDLYFNDTLTSRVTHFTRIAHIYKIF